jgi:hypothetical protein
MSDPNSFASRARRYEACPPQVCRLPKAGICFLLLFFCFSFSFPFRIAPYPRGPEAQKNRTLARTARTRHPALFGCGGN